MNNEVQPKPCPFCGTIPAMYEKEEMRIYFFHTICCKKCGANIQDSDKSKVIEKWNRRYNDE